VAVDGSESLSNSDRLNVYNYTGDDRTQLSGDASGWEEKLYHAVADMALGTGDPESSANRLGVRVRAGYDRLKRGNTGVDHNFYSTFPLDEVELEYRYNNLQGEFERIGAELSFGLSRNDGWLAQAVIGGGGIRETLVNTDHNRSMRDEDYDGNGLGRQGDTTPRYSRTDVDYDANRSYDNVFVFGRLGLNWGERVRSFHRLTWGESTGNGDGDLIRDYYSSELIVSRQYNTVTYGLDGNSKNFATDHVVAFADNVLENLMVAFGLRAQVVYTEFREDGVGDGYFYSSEDVTVVEFATPYNQRATYTQESWLLSIPFAFEWNLHRNVSWRFGVDFRATRLDTNGELFRDLDIDPAPEFDDLLPFKEIDRRIDYDTRTYLSMGLTFSFQDRLALDVLTAVSSSAFNAANVASALLKFSF